MKLNRLTIKRFIGIDEADIVFHSPVTLFTGTNNQGKSSVRDAILFALTGKCRAGTKWKDAAELTRAGGRTGVKLTGVDPDGKESTVVRSPSTASTKADENPLIRYCLDPMTFVRLDSGERAKVLAAVCGGGATKLAKAAIKKHVGNINKAILAEMKDRSCDFADIDAFRAAVTELRREYKRQLAATVGKPPLAGDYQLPADFNLEQCEAKIEALADRIEKGADLIANERERLKIEAEIFDLRKQIKDAPKPRKLPPEPASDMEALRLNKGLLEIIDQIKSGVNAAVNGTCPLCDSKRTREKMKASFERITTYVLANEADRQDYDHITAENAKDEKALVKWTQRLAELQAKDAKGKELAAGSETLLADLTTERDVLQENITASRLFAQAEKAYTEAQAASDKTIGLIDECNRIDTALKDGGPVKADIAAGGQDLPVDQTLLELWGMEALQLSDIGVITLRGIRIETCSGSEQYRASCALGMALAKLSGFGVVALDGFDILDADNKNAFMKVVSEADLQVLLFATSGTDYAGKQIPDWLTVYNVEAGKVEAI